MSSTIDSDLSEFPQIYDYNTRLSNQCLYPYVMTEIEQGLSKCKNLEFIISNKSVGIKAHVFHIYHAYQSHANALSHDFALNYLF